MQEGVIMFQDDKSSRHRVMVINLSLVASAFRLIWPEIRRPPPVSHRLLNRCLDLSDTISFPTLSGASSAASIMD